MPTYNHEKYIGQAIESVLAQITKYSFNLLISDDCSTDSTAEIAVGYAEKHPDKIIFFQKEKNHGLLENYKFLLGKTDAKYIAVLESDDIWSNEHKLEKQISFLENHPDYGLCCGDYSEINEEGSITKIWKKDFDKQLNGNWFDSLLIKDHIGALTIVFRKSLYDKYCNIDDYIKLNFKTFDYPTILSLTKHAKAFYIHENLAQYRILQNSISNTSDYEKLMDFQDSVSDIQEYIIKKEFIKSEKCIGGGLYKQIVENRILIRLTITVRFRRLKDFVFFSKQLKSTKLKYKLLHYFPRLWYIQHILRIKEI